MMDSACRAYIRNETSASDSSSVSFQSAYKHLYGRKIPWRTFFVCKLCGFDWRNSMSLNNQTVGGGMWTCISKLQYAEEMNMNDSQFIHMRRNPKKMGKALLVAPSLFKCVTTLSQLESSRCSLRYIPHRANNFSPKKAHTQFACHPVMCWVFDFCISFPLCHRASAFTHSLFLWSALDVRPSHKFSVRLSDNISSNMRPSVSLIFIH